MKETKKDNKRHKRPTRRFRLQGIQKKLVVSIGLLVAISYGAMGIFSYFHSANAINRTVSELLPQLSIQTSQLVKARVEGRIMALEAVAGNKSLGDPEVSIADKIALLNALSHKEADIMGVVDLDGNAQFVDGHKENIADTIFFQKAMEGTGAVSEPHFEDSNNTFIVKYIVPIYQNDVITGALISISDAYGLSEMIEDVGFGESGHAFILDSEGTIIAYKDRMLVRQQRNLISKTESDPKEKTLSNVAKQMINHQVGVERYVEAGKEFMVAYTPIEGTSWSLGVEVEVNEILSQLIVLSRLLGSTAAFWMVVGLIVVLSISYKIAASVSHTAQQMRLLAQGNLRFEINKKYMNSNDEVGEMLQAMQEMQLSLSDMIRRIKSGFLNVSDEAQKLSVISEEMANASQNVAESIHDVAEGTNNQAQEIIDMTQTLNNFAGKLSAVLNNIFEVDQNSKEIHKMASESSNEMNGLNNSIKEISQSFNGLNDKIWSFRNEIEQIDAITALINGVAEQTNLLSLNAAIEAARAGEAGRGFAVVAEEIRKLAEQTRRSSSEITKVIASITRDNEIIVQDALGMEQQMKEQIAIVHDAISSFGHILRAVENVNVKINVVRGATEEIEQDKDSVMAQMEELSAIAMEVSASSEEIAATSQEMSASTEEVATASHVLSDMAVELSEDIDRFMI